ncbi:glycosyltransferase family 4 protein [Balneola vulgaris]|uniref:glycosyltransferase family 4 protein n=1 Tax=Balneola vulgaris TaxID=287535 RepID=UPI000373DD29|nr:glycosyltransferase family 4 protein [Balneola vulgaris]
MNKILFITDNFPPEVNAPATRTYEHAKEWVKLGLDVTIITCAPNFPQGKVYKGYKNKFRETEVVDGIKVIRVWSYITTNAGFVKRTLDYLSFAFMATLHGLFEKADIIVATSPQFFTTWCGYTLSILKRRPWVFELRDLWPESIVSVGAMGKGKLYDFLERIELFLYKKATIVIPNTDAFKENLIKRAIDPAKIHVIQNGANLELFDTSVRCKGLKKDIGFDDRPVVGYIGTHGMAHGLDFIIESINSENLDYANFLFIGDGAEKEKVMSLAKKYELKNIVFHDPIPKEEIPKYLSIVDVSLIPLKKSDTFKTVIPSKIYETCAMNKPILLGVEGEAKKLIDEYEVGLCFEPENAVDFAHKLNRLLTNSALYSKLEKNTATLASDFDRKVMAKKMMDLLINSQ